MRNRGVSNVLGYVLLFAIVLSSITLVGTVGVGQLTEARDSTLAMNAEHSMTGVASAVDDVHSDNVSRTSRLRLGSGSLKAGDATEVTVSIDGSQVAPPFTAEPIVFETGDTRILYVLGAVFRLEERGETVVSAPNYGIDSDSAVVPIPLTSAWESGDAVSGSNAQVRLNRSDARKPDSGGSSVRLELDTPRNRQAQLWYSILKERYGFNCGSPPGGDTVDCTHSASNVLVRTTTTQFELST